MVGKTKAKQQELAEVTQATGSPDESKQIEHTEEHQGQEGEREQSKQVEE